MKKIFALAAIVLTATTAQAQIVSSNSTKITTVRTEKAKKESKDYNRLYFGYANISFHGDAEDADILHGFSLGYAHASNLASQLPLYLEYGGEIAFNKNNKNYLYGLLTLNHKCLGLDIPINLTYRVVFDNGLYIAPYGGIAFRCNIVGKSAYNISGYNDEYESLDGDGELDWFDDFEFRRFQFGGQIGVNLGYKALNIGIGYRMFTPLYRDGFKMNTHSFSATLGFNF